MNPTELKESLSKLEMVQELDLQLWNINKKIAEFPARLAPMEEELKTLKLKLDEKKKIIDELERVRKQQVAALDISEDRIKRSEERMGQVKTDLEFSALQREIESTKKNIEIMHKTTAQAEADFKTNKEEYTTLENTIAALTTKIEEETAKINGETTGFDTNVSELNAKRKSAIEGISARILSVYDRTRMAKMGIGIALATAGKCRGCNLTLPAQVYNEIQRFEELTSCPMCKRILFYKS